MFKPTGGFSGFSVDDLEKAREFYSQTLGLEVSDEGAGLGLHVPGGPTVFFYPKGPAHQPATYTILNFEVENVEAAVDELTGHVLILPTMARFVENVEAAVDELTGRGVVFQKYPGNTYQDEKGIQRGEGPTIAWFTDPAGNIFSIIEG